MTFTAEQARRLLMGAQGLLDDPSAQARSPAALLKLIERMGFVQIDTINTVDRAHHLILASRSDSYRHEWLDQLAGPKRKLFEHWTHDASFIPTRWFPHWRPRFERYRAKSWHHGQMGPDAQSVLTHVLNRVRAEGPLRSMDFEHTGERRDGSWWDWKPHKLALDYLWRIGELYIVARHGFQKIYDLTERAVAEYHASPAVTESEHVEWSCVTALERLGVATASEVTNFWRAIPLAKARAWLQSAERSGRVVPVHVKFDGGSRASYALPDVKRTLPSLPEATPRARLLCPFDPVLRDRDRLKRLFDFDYRFEGFVPAKKRRFGYYVMPILRGDKLIGRVDPKFHRDTGVLQIKKIGWEPTVRPEKRLLRELEGATEQLSAFLGASRIEITARRRGG